MKIWARMLADLPPTLQRLIARAQRISLPRSCPAPERLRRLRAALCRQRTVRVTYFALPPDVQAVVQELRAIPRGLSPADLTTRYGPIRPWSQIQQSPRPQSLSEQLVLLGWLLPRPATPRHPTRYLFAPELRAALPRPFMIATHGPAPQAPLPPAVRAATTILLASAQAPLALRKNGTVRTSNLRRIIPRLAPLPSEAAEVLCQFVTPLLGDLGLLAPHVDGTAVVSPAGQRFLGQPSATQQARRRDAWVAAPRPDAWLVAVSRNRQGIDWPLFRRRLLIWATTLPAQQLVDPADTDGALAQALGPLADAQTHGFRRVSRTPWGPPAQARIWQAALREPLTWLGVIAWAAEDTDALGGCFAVAEPPGASAAADDPGLLQRAGRPDRRV